MPLLFVLLPWRVFRHFQAAARGGELKWTWRGLGLFAKNLKRVLAARAPVSARAYREHFKRAHESTPKNEREPFYCIAPCPR